MQCLWCCMTCWLPRCLALLKRGSDPLLPRRSKKCWCRLMDSWHWRSHSEVRRELKGRTVGLISHSCRNIWTDVWLSWMDCAGVTCIKHLNLAGDARAAVIHGGYLNSVAVAAREGVEVTGEVRGPAADAVLMTLCCHHVLFSTQTGRPRHQSSVVVAVRYHGDICGSTRHCRRRI